MHKSKINEDHEIDEINKESQNVQAWGSFKFFVFILHNIYRPL